MVDSTIDRGGGIPVIPVIDDQRDLIRGILIPRLSGSLSAPDLLLVIVPKEVGHGGDESLQK